MCLGVDAPIAVLEGSRVSRVETITEAELKAPHQTLFQADGGSGRVGLVPADEASKPWFEVRLR